MSVLKVVRSGQCLACFGREFQREGAAIEKGLSPQGGCLVLCGGVRRSASKERRLRDDVWQWSRSPWTRTHPFIQTLQGSGSLTSRWQHPVYLWTRGFVLGDWKKCLDMFPGIKVQLNKMFNGVCYLLCCFSSYVSVVMHWGFLCFVLSVCLPKRHQFIIVSQGVCSLWFPPPGTLWGSQIMTFSTQKFQPLTLTEKQHSGVFNCTRNTGKKPTFKHGKCNRTATQVWYPSQKLGQDLRSDKQDMCRKTKGGNVKQNMTHKGRTSK